MASVVGSSCLKRGVNSHIGIFNKIFQHEPAPQKSRFFCAAKFIFYKF